MVHKVLCVDDEIHNLEALERLLRKQYTTVKASSGSEALQKLKEHSFSLIISDQKMPQMTGVEFFMEAKKLQPDAVRVLLTGYTDLESVIGAINQGQIFRYITKPWEPEEFLGIVRQAVEVFEMKKTIAEQNEELRSLDKLKSDFMILVNHELKTPLTGIFSFVQLLQEEKMDETKSLYVNKIAKNTQRLQDLINDTLLITQLKASTEPLKTETVDLAKIIPDLWAQLEKDSKSKNLKLKAPKKSFNLLTNANYLAIVLKKLLHNVHSYAKTESTAEVQWGEDTTDWTLTIRNESAQALAKNPQELLGAFTKEGHILNHSGGTGLGLAVVQAIVNRLKGKLTIEAQNNQFSVEIKFPKPQL